MTQFLYHWMDDSDYGEVTSSGLFLPVKMNEIRDFLGGQISRHGIGRRQGSLSEGPCNASKAHFTQPQDGSHYKNPPFLRL